MLSEDQIDAIRAEIRLSHAQTMSASTNVIGRLVLLKGFMVNSETRRP